MTVVEHYGRERERFLVNCTRCGLCVQECPIIPHTGLADSSSRDIQQGVFDFLDTGRPNPAARTKAFACMECFKCVSGVCPEGLNPMLINELIKGEYIAAGLETSGFSDTRRPDCAQRVMAGVQVSAADYERITRPSDKTTARYVFFPGCNAYFQPDKLLNALDILEAVGDDVAFLPGLDFCCGDNHWFYGDIRGGGERAAELVAALAGFQPAAVILWCPTCLCRFEFTIRPSMDPPFDVMSFPQYLATNMNRLPLGPAAAGTVTLHEACKAAYTGVDERGPREVLRQLPGVELREMKRHGKETACCGSGAISWFPESCARMREERLKEAAETGAEKLVTVCHYCAQTFIIDGPDHGLTVTGYEKLVAEALGVHREERFRQYAQMGDLDRILREAEVFIQQAPFDRDRMVEVLQAVFGR